MATPPDVASVPLKCFKIGDDLVTANVSYLYQKKLIEIIGKVLRKQKKKQLNKTKKKAGEKK